jgi:hypothetical protein
LTSFGFVSIFHHLTQFFGGKNDNKADACLIFYHFTMPFIDFNIFDTFGPKYFILVINLLRSVLANITEPQTIEIEDGGWIPVRVWVAVSTFTHPFIHPIFG